MSGFSEMFRGDFLYYNLFVYSIIPCMFLFFFLQPLTVLMFLVGYIFAFSYFMTHRELKKRKSKEGQMHFDSRIFRSQYAEEMILSFTKNFELTKADQDLLGDIKNEPAFKNAVMYIINLEEEEQKEYDSFMEKRKGLENKKKKAMEKRKELEIKKKKTTKKISKKDPGEKKINSDNSDNSNKNEKSIEEQKELEIKKKKAMEKRKELEIKKKKTTKKISTKISKKTTKKTSKKDEKQTTNSTTNSKGKKKDDTKRK